MCVLPARFSDRKHLGHHDQAANDDSGSLLGGQREPQNDEIRTPSGMYVDCSGVPCLSRAVCTQETDSGVRSTPTHAFAPD